MSGWLGFIFLSFDSLSFALSLSDFYLFLLKFHEKNTGHTAGAFKLPSFLRQSENNIVLNPLEMCKWSFYRAAKLEGWYLKKN